MGRLFGVGFDGAAPDVMSQWQMIRTAFKVVIREIVHRYNIMLVAEIVNGAAADATSCTISKCLG